MKAAALKTTLPCMSWDSNNLYLISNIFYSILSKFISWKNITNSYYPSQSKSISWFPFSKRMHKSSFAANWFQLQSIVDYHATTIEKCISKPVLPQCRIFHWDRAFKNIWIDKDQKQPKFSPYLYKQTAWKGMERTTFSLCSYQICGQFRLNKCQKKH